MGIFDKIKGMVGSEDLDYNEYDGDLFGDEMPGADPMTDTQGAQSAYDAGYSPFDAQPQPQPQPQRQQAPMGGSNLELKVVKPDRYEMVNQIADHLLNRRTVVLNLEGTNKETARRLIDFLSGVAYAGEGKIKKVAANTYIITPYHVDIMGDLIDELENNGLYL